MLDPFPTMLELMQSEQRTTPNTSRTITTKYPSLNHPHRLPSLPKHRNRLYMADQKHDRASTTAMRTATVTNPIAPATTTTMSTSGNEHDHEHGSHHDHNHDTVIAASTATTAMTSITAYKSVELHPSHPDFHSDYN